MRNIYIAGIVSIFLSACATYEPIIPKDYTGPTAEISDDFLWETSSKNQLFFVDSINGKPIESALILSRRATAGHGFAVSAKTPTHKIPAVPLRLKLVATHITGAPIHEMASRAAGTFFSIEGEVNFNPVENGRYRVAGTLKKEGSSVWIIDAKTKERVSDIVSEVK